MAIRGAARVDAANYRTLAAMGLTRGDVQLAADDLAGAHRATAHAASDGVVVLTVLKGER